MRWIPHTEQTILLPALIENSGNVWWIEWRRIRHYRIIISSEFPGFFSRTAYFRAVNFSDFARKREGENRVETRLFERIAFSVRSFVRSARRNFHFQRCSYSHVAFALDITEGIARSSEGRVVIQDKKTVRGEGGWEEEREREKERETNNFIVTPSLRFVRKRSWLAVRKYKRNSEMFRQ